MTVREVARRDPVTLSPGDTVSRAAELLVEEQLLALPVVEGDRLVGMFGLHELVALLMPRAVTLGRGLEGLADLDFVADTLEELRERLDHVCASPVRAHLESGRSRALHPDSSFTEALFLVYRLGRDLPVVEEETERLVGMVSPWDVLETLRQR
ncbi:MAG TPA: CBS domain-containing protein [Gemmatimonadota bacterium]|nr:CBS domain-containing protein [Gemmatimonadota bacterium]